MQMEGRIGEAVRSYQAALAKDPHHSPAALALGTLLAQPGTHQEPSLAEVCHGRAVCCPSSSFPFLLPDRLVLKCCVGRLQAVLLPCSYHANIAII